MLDWDYAIQQLKAKREELREEKTAFIQLGKQIDIVIEYLSNAKEELTDAKENFRHAYEGFNAKKIRNYIHVSMISEVTDIIDTLTRIRNDVELYKEQIQTEINTTDKNIQINTYYKNLGLYEI